MAIKGDMILRELVLEKENLGSPWKDMIKYLLTISWSYCVQRNGGEQ